MLRRGRDRVHKLFFSVALLSLGAVSAAGIAYRAPLQEAAERLRIRWKPAHVVDLLERDPGSPGGKAARWFAKTAEGRQLLLGAYLEKQIHGRAESLLQNVLRGPNALVLWSGPDNFDYYQDTGHPSPRRLKGTTRPGDHSRSIQLLLGEAGAEELTSPDYPDLSFSFVRPDRKLLQEIYTPGRGLPVMPTLATFTILEDENAPPFVCLVLRSDAQYPRLLTHGSF